MIELLKMKRYCAILGAFLFLAFIPCETYGDADLKCYLNIVTNYPGSDYWEQLAIIQGSAPGGARWGIIGIDATPTNIHSSMRVLPALLTYTIRFSTVTNYNIPALQSVVLTNNITLTNSYIPYSNTLSVIVAGSSVPVIWTLCGPNEFTNSSAYRTSGSNNIDLIAVPTGTYAVTFPTMRGYATPATLATNITGASPLINTLAADYAAYSNSLAVTVAGIITSTNVYWTLAGPVDFTNAVSYGTTFTNSFTLAVIPTGIYTATFPAIPGYTTPAAAITNIIGDPLTNSIIGIYIPATWVTTNTGTNATSTNPPIGDLPTNFPVQTNDITLMVDTNGLFKTPSREQIIAANGLLTNGAVGQQGPAGTNGMDGAVGPQGPAGPVTNQIITYLGIAYTITNDPTSKGDILKFDPSTSNAWFAADQGSAGDLSSWSGNAATQQIAYIAIITNLSTNYSSANLWIDGTVFLPADTNNLPALQGYIPGYSVWSNGADFRYYGTSTWAGAGYYISDASDPNHLVNWYHTGTCPTGLWINADLTQSNTVLYAYGAITNVTTNTWLFGVTTNQVWTISVNGTNIYQGYPQSNVFGGVTFGNGSGWTNLTAANLAGTVNAASLGSGTTNSGVFLRGDQAWTNELSGNATATAFAVNTNQFIVTNGKVGIGTNNPATAFHVVGAMLNNGSVEFNRTGDATCGDFSVSGTNNPAMYFGRLSPKSGDNTRFVFRTRLGMEKFSIDLGAAGDIVNRIENGATGNIVFTDSATEWARFSYSKNFLLGTTSWGSNATKTIVMGTGSAPTNSPADTVQLYSRDTGGAAGKAGLHIRTEDGTTHVLGNKVGIGTTNASEMLEVAGNIKASGTNTAVVMALNPQASAPPAVLGGMYVDSNGVFYRCTNGTSWTPF